MNSLAAESFAARGGERLRGAVGRGALLARRNGGARRVQAALFKDRYSHFVGLMKFGLPAAAAAMIGLIALWPHLTFDNDFRIGFLSALKVRDLENLTLVRARYLGTDEKNRPYTVTAEMATQANPKSDLVTLSAPAADITLEDGTWVALTAKTGELHQKSRSLDLIGQVSIFHDDGYSFRTESVRIDLAAGTAIGDEEIIGYGPMGRIEASGIRVLDKGRRVVFTGKARLVILPGADERIGSALGGLIE